MTVTEPTPMTPEQLETIDLHRALKEKLAGPRTGSEAAAGRPSWYAEPSIRGVSPTRGHPGDTVVIQGSRLESAFGVAVGGVPAEMRSKSWHQVTAEVPATARSGPITVQVPTAGGLLTAPEDFVVLEGDSNGRRKPPR